MTYAHQNYRRANYSEQISSPPPPPTRIIPKTTWKQKSQALLVSNSPNSSNSRHLRSGSVSSSTSSASMGSSGFISAGQDIGTTGNSSSESQEYRQSRTVHLQQKRRSVHFLPSSHIPPQLPRNSLPTSE